MRLIILTTIRMLEMCSAVTPGDFLTETIYSTVSYVTCLNHIVYDSYHLDHMNHIIFIKNDYFVETEITFTYPLQNQLIC